MTVFSFPYLEGKTKDGKSVFRPWVRIKLQGSDNNWSTFQLFADAGADITLLRSADCQMLGYQPEAGEMRFMSGVCSGLIRTFIHELPLNLGTETFPCRVAFAEKADVPRLLGRNGVFQHFKVCYDDVARVTQFFLRES